MTQPSPSLRLPALTTMVIGSMIGGGIFSLPQNMAQNAAAGAILIGWAITAVGMLMLAFVFQNLANQKPELDAGVYAYAKAGFGHYMGFSSAWGYWISAFLGNVSYFVLLFSTLGFFFPVFENGNTAPAIIAASVLLWAVHFLVLRGVKQAAFINQITTIAKIVPLLLFIVLAAIAFKQDVFSHDFWGQGNIQLGSVGDQVKNMMLVTVWVFIGIEGASVYSARAKRRADVGRATVIGFLCTLLLLVLVNVLSLGIISQAELAGLKNPSMAYVLEHIVGRWGAILISLGLMISLLGALLSWTLLCAEILFSAAQDHTMPKFLSKENANGVPANALLLSNLAVQAFLLLALAAASTYTSLLLLASSMILVPYFFSTAYAVMVAQQSKASARQWAIALIATAYSIWLIYAAGTKFLLLSALLYAPGVFFYAKARREQQQQLFTPAEKYLCAAMVGGALFAGYSLYSGIIQL